jgi:hypothetical protein
MCFELGTEAPRQSKWSGAESVRWDALRDAGVVNLATGEFYEPAAASIYEAFVRGTVAPADIIPLIETCADQIRQERRLKGRNLSARESERLEFFFLEALFAVPEIEEYLARHSGGDEPCP